VLIRENATSGSAKSSELLIKGPNTRPNTWAGLIRVVLAATAPAFSRALVVLALGPSLAISIAARSHRLDRRFWGYRIFSFAATLAMTLIPALRAWITAAGLHIGPAALKGIAGAVPLGFRTQGSALI